MAWKLNDEPAAVFGAAFEVLRQGIPLLVLLGVWTLTKEQLLGVMLFVSPLLTFLSVVFTRNQSVSNSTANKQIEVAKKADSSTPNADIIAEAAKA